MEPDIVVEITLSPAPDGGARRALCWGQYRAVLGVDAGHFSVRFLVVDECALGPGDTARAGVQFLVPEVALQCFPAGTAFTVWEGGLTGRGRVVEVLRRA